MSADVSPRGLFEHYASVWVLLTIVAGLGLGLARWGAALQAVSEF